MDDPFPYYVSPTSLNSNTNEIDQIVTNSGVEPEDAKKFLTYYKKQALTKENIRSFEKDGEVNNLLKEDVGIADRTQRNKLATALREWIQQPVQPAPVTVKKTTVCVTGATGFIASHIVEQLLTKGYRVHGTVRSKDPKKVKHLLDIQKITGGELELFEAELLKDASFANAIHGCDYVMHTASPFIVSVKDPIKDLVKPAVEGTRNVLLSAAHVPSVKRVILTSSMAAITDSPSGVLTEKNWNEKSSTQRNPYYYSKTQAELAAWKFMKESSPKFDLVAINPFLVVGPSHTETLNESPKIILGILNGVFPVIMDLTWGIVDVRDVAKAHILAMENPKANGRYICVDHTIGMADLAQYLQKNFPEISQKVATSKMDSGPGTSLMKVLSVFQPSGTKDYLQTHLGKELKIDNTKIKQELGITFLPLHQSLSDTIQDFKKYGHITAAATKKN